MSARMVFSLLVATITLITGCVTLEGVRSRERDDFVRNHTMYLKLPNGGQCTGTMVHSPWNGKSYVLTAGHCFGRQEPDTKVTGILESGQEARLHVLKVDHLNDLAILDNPWNTGLEIGPLAAPHDSVRVIAWGHGAPPYVSGGEILRSSFLFEHEASLVQRLLSTARVIPGCSGGPMVNENNELVGIMLIAYEDTAFSNGCPTFIIIDFMKDVY